MIGRSDVIGADVAGDPVWPGRAGSATAGGPTRPGPDTAGARHDLEFRVTGGFDVIGGFDVTGGGAA
ncbi:hypothetical protein J2S55_004318 [Streptosporangium brasiliense]|uniref:Uncharacterized protein n=1 Tax=Streptosporangium brasiliense TaxID=47480 RepID=A0ABT9R729_9ACTN|nr:hypothetical protein [Streptosporangium brasiliense]